MPQSWSPGLHRIPAHLSRPGHLHRVPAGPSPFPQTTRLPLGHPTCRGGWGCSGGEDEGCRRQGCRTFHGPPGDGPVVSADRDQAGTEPVGRVVDDVPVVVAPAFVGALAGWGHSRCRAQWSPSPRPLTNPAPPYPRGCVCTGCHLGCSHWEGEREELRACRGQATPTSPGPRPAHPICPLTSSGSSLLSGRWHPRHSNSRPGRSSHTGPHTSSGLH